MKSLQACKAPTNIKQLRGFLGLVNFYRRFVPHCAEILMPLTDMLKAQTRRSRKPLLWTCECEIAFTRINEELARATLLAFPDTDFPMSLMCDASDRAIDGVLQQKDGVWQPLAFFSKKLQPAETRYSAFGRELLAIYLAIKHFRDMLDGRVFCVFTHHKPLIYASCVARH